MTLFNSRYNRLQESEPGSNTSSEFRHVHSSALTLNRSLPFDNRSPASPGGSEWGYDLGAQDRKQSAQVNVEPFGSAGPRKASHQKGKAMGGWKLWQPAAIMASLIALGTVTAIAHHIAYRYLDGKHISTFPQLWARNLGSAAAFLVKTCFTIATGIAFQEVLWQSLRRRLTKIGSIDKLFSVHYSPLGFFTADGFKTAPIAMLLAAIAWTIPLAAIITPATLNIDLLATSKDLPCTTPTFAGGDPDIKFYKTEAASGVWNGPSQDLEKAALKVIPKGDLLAFTSPCGSNCSFETSFFAPAIKCVDRENPSSLTDTQKWTYYTATIAEDEHKTDEVPLWIQISYNNYDSMNKSAAESSSSTQDSLSRTIVCSAYNATYDLSVTYVNNIPNFTTSIKTYHEPVSAILSLYKKAALQCGPKDCPKINFSTLVLAVFDYLKGTVDRVGNEPVSVDSQVQNIPLASAGDGKVEWEVLRDFATAVPELVQNLTISTFSFTTKQQSTTCKANSVDSAYVYKSLWLLLPYGAALALALLAFVLGLSALQSTGVATGSTFSQILVTTRNPALDEVVAGAGLSSRDAVWVSEQRIRLGELRTEQGAGADRSVDGEVGSGEAAFGVQGQTMTLRKGVAYH